MNKKCILCESENLKNIYTLNEIPVFQNKVYKTKKEAVNCLHGSVDLFQCQKCGFVFNNRFDSTLMNYDEDYHNEQAYSNVFKKHMMDTFNLIENRINMKDKIIEIGCGKGDFFDFFYDKGFDIIGYDPSYTGEKKKVFKRFFSENEKVNADVFILRHTLEHIENPKTFIEKLKKINNNNAKIFIEVPVFDWIAEKKAFWDVFYEHCNYFTYDSVEALFEKFNIMSLFNGQYMLIEADLNRFNKSNVLKKTPNMFDFDFDLSEIEKLLISRKKSVIWGAGAKGNAFLNILDKKCSKVDYVIDINPNKQGKYIGGTGHKIYSPDKIRKNTPDMIIIMNSNYKDEILRFTGQDIDYKIID